jgi:hypothetical protein
LRTLQCKWTFFPFATCCMQIAHPLVREG